MSQSNLPRIDASVIIVNYNTTELIIKCLDSIFIHTEGINYEIIIVDNASEPDFGKRILNEFPIQKEKMLFLHLQENIGFGRANNKGLELSSGRNIFFLNPDTVVINNAISILSKFLDNNKEAGACGGNLLTENMTPNLSFRRILPGIRWELNELLNCIPQKIIYGQRYYYESANKASEVGYITGADLMIKKEIINKIGSFAPDFFMYYEETDLCARIKKNGWKIYCVPQAYIQHLDGKSFKGSPVINKFKIEIQEQSRATYYNLNTSKSKHFIADMIYGLYLITRMKLLPEGTKKECYRIRKQFFHKYRRTLPSKKIQ